MCRVEQRQRKRDERKKRERERTNERKRRQRRKRERERETYYIGCFEGAWAFSQRVRSLGEGALAGDKRETYEG